MPPSPSPSPSPAASTLSSASAFASSALASRPSRSPSPSAPAEDPDPDPDTDPRTRTRREEAFTLYCQGYRSPAIASLLGVPQRTVRSWIAATLQQTADESRTRRDHQLRLAIESQRAIVQAAWHAYARAARAERLTLEHLQNAVPFNLDDADADDALDLSLDADPYDPASPHGVGARHGATGRRVRSLALPRLPTLGARYLQIVLHAQREIARLSGLYSLPDTVHDPNAGRPMQIVIRREAHLPREQRVAWTAFRQQWDAAHPDDPVPPDDLVFPPPGVPLHDYADPDDDFDNPESDDPNPYGVCPDDEPAADCDESTGRGMPDAAPAEDPATDRPRDPALPAQTESAAETAIPASTADHSPVPSPTPPSAAPRGASQPDLDRHADRQPAQAGFVAEWPVGAISPAGPPAAVHPSLLPRFRHRSSLSSPRTHYPRFGGTP